MAVSIKCIILIQRNKGKQTEAQPMEKKSHKDGDEGKTGE